MPPSKQNAGDVLRRHESKIRKLYATKSIESVKRIMERESGFPELAVATWIEKIGDLGIRKNVSSDEWRMIYLHCLCWLEDPTRKKGDLKLKRTKQEIEVVVRGRKYSWDQAWRNMKSAGAIGQLRQPGEPLDPLPSDIEIRTLSPVSLPVRSTPIGYVAQPSAGATNTLGHDSLSRDRKHTSPQTNSLSSDNSLSLVPASYNHQSNRSNEWARDCAKRIWIYWTSLLPIATLIDHTIEIQNLDPLSGTPALQRSRKRSMTVFATDSLPDTFGDVEHGYISKLQCKLRDHFLSALLWPPTTDLTTSTTHKNYAKFFTVIYLLSNKFVEVEYIATEPHIDLFRELDLVFAAVPAEYLEDLIRSRLVSIRAAYEALLILTGHFRQQSAFQLLLKIGFRYDWIAVPFWGHRLLYYAVSMHLEKTLQLLLDKGCCPGTGSMLISPNPLQDRHFPTAICKAFERGCLECAQLLLDNCDVNASIDYAWGLSNFDYFLDAFDDDEERLEYGLHAFIRAGADVNKPVVSALRCRFRPLGIWDHDPVRDIPSCERETPLSVLDYLFYFHRRVFYAISSKSNQTQPGFLSRACIFLALEGGIQNLQQHLNSIARRIGQPRISDFLQLLIAEQFLVRDLTGRKRATDLKTVCALASCGVTIGEVIYRFPDILDEYIKLIQWPGDDSDMEAIQYLLEHGANVGGSALSCLARLPERRLFDLALNHVGSQSGWHIALVDVASRNDFQAVERLLHGGVDLDVDTKDPELEELSVSLIARFTASPACISADLPEMLEILIRNGAVLRLSKRRSQLHHLLRFILDQFHDRDTQEERTHRQATVQYIVRAEYKDNMVLPSSLLETGNSATFEHLFRYGAQLRPGSPLAYWIEEGGGIGLVREMLAAGASPNAYSRKHRQNYRRTPLQAAALVLNAEIIELLLEEGADINAAARGRHGCTALQAACMRYLHFARSNEEQLETVQLLLARGANVNAAPARKDGYTALQETAATGDLAVAKLLLLHNPMADVNAPPCQGQYKSPSEFGTALDVAAKYGRLEMVKLLLSCNALSHRHGENGYDGAVFLAEQNGHLAIADLICQHAKDDQRLPIHLRNPYLSEPTRHWSEYGYKLDFDEDSELSYDTDSVESDYTDEESSSPIGTDSDIPCDADERTAPGAVQETHPFVYPDVKQASGAVYNHGAQNSTQPFANGTFSTPATLDNNTWADQGGLDLEFEGNDVATLYPICASNQMDFGVSMDLDMSLGSGIGEDVGVQYADSLDYELDAPERLIYEVDGGCE